MFKANIKTPSKRDLTKLVTNAAEKQITEKVRRAAAPFGGLRIRFTHKSDRSMDSVHFEGSTNAVHAARDAIAS